MLDPPSFSGDSRTNQLIINRLNEEQIFGDLIMKGIQDPGKLSVLRFYIIIFRLEKQNKPRNENSNNDSYNR